MKVVILAGGMGTRISEESQTKPKPMIELGGKPILWHIMKYFSCYGFNDFIICCGYKGHMIKQYFMNYYTEQSNITVNMENSNVDILNNESEQWKVTLVNTGLHTLTAGRLLKVKDYIGDNQFMLTYGDGVADININRLMEFHNNHGKITTISSSRPAGRFGAIKINEDTQQVESFKEKARKDQSWVNIGFMIFQPKIFDYLGDGSSMLEGKPFEMLVSKNEMMAYCHEGFWSPMDNIHDKKYLEDEWNSGNAPWKVF